MLLCSLKCTLLRAVLVCFSATAALSTPAVAGNGGVPDGQAVAEQPTASHRAHSPNLWYVDVAEMGSHCIIDTGHIELWRAAADKPAMLRLSGPANFPSASVEFASGQSVVGVDAAVFPVADGSTMTVSDAASGATIGQIDFVVLPTSSADPQNLAEAMRAHGCTAQLELLRTLPAPRG